MELVIRPDAAGAAALAARLVEARLRAAPALVLGLAAGRTMVPVYARLVASGVSFGRARTFNLDEYVGLAAEDPASFRSFVRAHLIDHVGIAPGNAHAPDTGLEAAAERYEAEIAAAGGIDLALLGIGEAGHIGFNEPLSGLGSRSRVVRLTRTTRRQNAPMFGGDPERVPARALTMGVGTILEAREIVLLATGSAKAAAVAKAVEGPLTAMVSASALQLHPDCKVILDAAAAEGLNCLGEVEGEPDWAQEPA